MRVLSVIVVFIAVLCCAYGGAGAQVRVRHGLRMPKFRHKERDAGNGYNPLMRPLNPEATITPPAVNKPNPTDDHFYVKWSKTGRLAYPDFKYNRNLYNKFLDDRDTDLINNIYPDYLAFYNRLKKRKATDPMGAMDEEQEERIDRMLRAKADSLEKGYISSASLSVELSFTISIDSPAASVIILTPVIYALSESTYYFNITPLFNKYESWMIVKSTDILQHEQFHFDIFELFARKMRKHLVEVLKKSYSEGLAYDVSTDITPYYEQLYAQLTQMQLDLDRQTGAVTATNKPLTTTNAAWIKLLHDQLDALKEYEQPEGTITLR